MLNIGVGVNANETRTVSIFTVVAAAHRSSITPAFYSHFHSKRETVRSLVLNKLSKFYNFP